MVLIRYPHRMARLRASCRAVYDVCNQCSNARSIHCPRCDKSRCAVDTTDIILFLAFRRFFPALAESILKNIVNTPTPFERASFKPRRGFNVTVLLKFLKIVILSFVFLKCLTVTESLRSYNDERPLIDRCVDRLWVLSGIMES